MKAKLSKNARASARDLAARDNLSGDTAERDAEVILFFGSNAWEAMCDAGMALHNISEVALANYMLQRSLAVLHENAASAATNLAQVMVDKLRLLDGGASPDEAYAVIRDRLQDAAEVCGALVQSKAQGSPQ